MQKDEGAKAIVKKRSILHYIKVLGGLALLIFLLAIFGVYSFLHQSLSSFNEVKPPDEFCTPDDPVVQSIEANAGEWLQLLDQTQGYPRIIFVEIGGKNYGVRLSGNEESRIFYITTQIRWPGTAEYGNNGYFCSPERDPSFSFGTRLIAKQLSDTVYCYWWNYGA